MTKRWLKIAAANAALLAVLLCAADLGLRLTRFDHARKPAVGNPEGYYVADAALGATLSKDFPRRPFVFRGPGYDVFTNAIGCFDKPVNLEPNEPYILATGDSFAWGYAPLETKWTSILERETGIRVLKCGVSGTGTRHQLERLKGLVDRLPHPPALVVHLYDTTDFNDDFTYPNYTAVEGQRVQSFTRIALADGAREPLDEAATRRLLREKRSRDRGFLKTHSTLYGILRMGILLESRVERRRLVIEGKPVTHLHDKYEFNLQLLDAERYPYVARKFGEHLATIREMHAYIRNLGARSAMFHTNSFRLPGDKPFVRRLTGFLDDFPPFLGWMPELPKYQFDPHWTPDSNARVARVMIERLKEAGLLPLPGKTRTSALR